MNNGIDGIDRLLQRLDSLTVDEETEQQILNQACIIVENQAKINCPVDAGTLRNSITHEVINHEGIVGTNIDYAIYVELGSGLFAVNGDGRTTPWSYQDDRGNWHTTVGQHPQPYLTTALHQQRQTVINFLKTKLRSK